MKKRISKILVANRGEIACRIIRTADKLGIKTVSVYSEVDKNSKNVLMADEAYYIGKAHSLDSYLSQSKIMNVAKLTKCDAIHPGYGFLSENAHFSEYCFQNNIVFIGPPSKAIKDMGIKSTSKKIMLEAGVPIIPGYHDNNQSNSVLQAEAERIGFPLMIKAVYGGGGKGMRIVLKKEEFLSQLDSARRESLSSFGNDDVLLEKFITAPRHVEVQVFADTYGDCVYLHERDCSIQRRHQKVIEEAPAPGIGDTLREKIGLAAVRAAKAVNYVGAGTVEFIFEDVSKNFYFMEMNTRLQVEHPITEMITGIDLVEWQIKIAEGEKLPLKQEDIMLKGHSVEARIYAEDPYNGFLPSAGPLIYFSMPKETDDVRFETGVREKDEVSVHYDPMIAKLVVWAQTRTEAFSKLYSKLQDCNIVGLDTNVEFLKKLSCHEKLLAGKVNTNFIDENKDALLLGSEPSSQIIAQAALSLVLWEEQRDLRSASQTDDPFDPFIVERGFRVNHLHTRELKFLGSDGKEFNLKITYNKSKSYSIEVNGRENFETNGYLTADSDGKISMVANFEDNVSKCKLFVQDDTFVHLFTEKGSFCFEIWRPKFDENISVTNEITAVSPMPGVINHVLVKPGDRVSVGDSVMVMIAMKMEHVIKAPRDGIIKEVLYEVGQNIPKNAAVITFEEN